MTQSAFHDLPAAAFPLTMVAWRTDNYEIVWREIVRVPGAVHVPALAERHGVPIGVAIFMANGQVSIERPSGS